MHRAWLLNSSSANPKKWSDTLKQFIGVCPFDHWGWRLKVNPFKTNVPSLHSKVLKHTLKQDFTWSVYSPVEF